jgi:tungstate transport system substrate-binding protein
VLKGKKPKRTIIFMLLVCMGVLGSGIIFSGVPGRAGEAREELLLATTTSTDNTGLIEYLMPSFTESTGIGIRWISTGTGKALKLGENCDVDVLLVHAPLAEIDFVARGFGIDRRQIMYNDFVLIGPPEDPAGIRGGNVSAALQAIRSSGNLFISRGDNSGTNKKEQTLWNSADVPIPEQEPWYRQSGQGMLASINMAAELQGYTLTDRGTYIKYESVVESNPALVILVEGDPDLLNQYSIIPINPEHCPNVKYEKTQTFSAWMAGNEIQQLIGEFKLLDKQLFTPNAAR